MKLDFTINSWWVGALLRVIIQQPHHCSDDCRHTSKSASDFSRLLDSYNPKVLWQCNRTTHGLGHKCILYRAIAICDGFPSTVIITTHWRNSVAYYITKNADNSTVQSRVRRTPYEEIVCSLAWPLFYSVWRHIAVKFPPLHDPNLTGKVRCILQNQE